MAETPQQAAPSDLIVGEGVRRVPIEGLIGRLGVRSIYLASGDTEDGGQRPPYQERFVALI